MAGTQPAIDPSLFTSPDAPLIGDTGHVIRIEPLGEGGVKVSVSYHGDRAKDKKVLVGILSSLVGLIAVLWLLRLFGIISGFTAGGASFILALILISAIRQYLVVRRSYVLQADHSGLSIEISDGKSSTTQHFTRPQITDISVAWDLPRRGGATTFSWWLVISTTISPDIRIMQNLDGNHYATIDMGQHHLRRIANVLRGALGMPPCS